MKYYIKTTKGYVAGFSTSHQVVQCTSAEYRNSHAKAFKTRKAAERFMLLHADIGYGLQREGTTIEEVAESKEKYRVFWHDAGMLIIRNSDLKRLACRKRRTTEEVNAMTEAEMIGLAAKGWTRFSK